MVPAISVSHRRCSFPRSPSNAFVERNSQRPSRKEPTPTAYPCDTPKGRRRRRTAMPGVSDENVRYSDGLPGLFDTRGIGIESTPLPPDWLDRAPPPSEPTSVKVHLPVGDAVVCEKSFRRTAIPHHRPQDDGLPPKEPRARSGSPLSRTRTDARRCASRSSTTVRASDLRDRSTVGDHRRARRGRHRWHHAFPVAERTLDPGAAALANGYVARSADHTRDRYATSHLTRYARRLRRRLRS